MREVSCSTRKGGTVGLARRWAQLVCLLLPPLLGIVWAAAARAEGLTAKEHYERGTTLYDLQRYSEAAREYEAAFELKPDPALLFNIGQAHRFARDYEKAIAAFRSYLRRLPRAANREEVESRIREMQRLLDQQQSSLQHPPIDTIPLTEPAATRPSAGGAAQPPPAEAASPASSRPLVSSGQLDQVNASSSPSPPPALAEAPRRRKLWWVGVLVGGVAAVGLAVGLGVGLPHSGSTEPTKGSISPGVLPVTP
jgi:tetratricopeptide (TPR) repeat protein